MTPYRILVIDDEPGIRSGVRQILELEGYAVAEAESGRTAFSLLEQTPFDVALIDYRLPDIDGLTLLQAIRKRRPGTMTCMITAYANLETAIAATRQGIDFFLPKPFAPDALISVIETLLRHKKVREEAERLRRAHEESLAALATEQSQTRSLVACLHDAVLVVNRQGTVVLANRAMAALLGHEEPELLQRPLADVLLGPELAPVRALLDEGVAERAGFELYLGARAYLVSLTPFRAPDGTVLGRILTLADMTALRRLSIEKARFVRTMVHEFRSPLGAVKGLLEVAQDKSLGDRLDPYLPMLARAEQRLDGLVELIGDLLSLSRIEAEQRDPVAPPPLDVAPLVEEVADLCRERATGRGITVDVEIASPLPPVRVAADDLRTVLVNLVANAVKYNREGGAVKVRLSPTAEWLRTDVTDTGLGILPENLPHLFDEFFREKRKETRDIEGNGLGLSIVKRLVERAGGRLEVSSVVGQGSTFSLLLPR